MAELQQFTNDEVIDLLGRVNSLYKNSVKNGLLLDAIQQYRKDKCHFWLVFRIILSADRTTVSNYSISNILTLIESDTEFSMEVCAGSHHWSRELIARSYKVKMIPPQFVIPPCIYSYYSYSDYPIAWYIVDNLTVPCAGSYLRSKRQR